MGRNTVRIGDVDVDVEALDLMERELRQYQSRRRRYDYLCLRYQEVPHESAGPGDGMPRGGGTGDPTLSRVEQLDEISEEMAELGSWLVTVDHMLGIDDEYQITGKGDLAEAQAFVILHTSILPRSRRLWTMAGVARELSVGERTAYRLRNEALAEFIRVLHPEWQKRGRIVAETWQTQPARRGYVDTVG